MTALFELLIVFFIIIVGYLAYREIKRDRKNRR